LSLLVNCRPGQDAGTLSQADDSLDLVGQAEGFGIADGGGEHVRRGLLVPGSGENVGSGDPLDHPASV
jgi:hypothetical protein